MTLKQSPRVSNILHGNREHQRNYKLNNPSCSARWWSSQRRLGIKWSPCKWHQESFYFAIQLFIQFDLISWVLWNVLVNVASQMRLNIFCVFIVGVQFWPNFLDALECNPRCCIPNPPNMLVSNMMERNRIGVFSTWGGILDPCAEFIFGSIEIYIYIYTFSFISGTEMAL